MPDASTFSSVGITLVFTHAVADHWVQTHGQAMGKGAHTHTGVRECATHVATYTAATALAVLVVWQTFDLAITPVGFVVGQMVSAVTHYWADRRYTLAALARSIGKEDYYNSPGGAYQLDQAWHFGWLGVATYLTAVIGVS
ncbi:DUF3307 domain-containing protein [Kribbella catacumbae]|uniref:DUF3307 domain-containing protein n=1 Tax=Kribbella catacumbae TaxID=460086 RepID=UPI00038170D9|nr:DUF3307 domain-containing protein [Kribbella catacumbae]